MEKTKKEPFEDGEPRYSCQGTEMLRAAPQRLPLKELSQFREDVASGNAGVRAVVTSFLIAIFNRYQDRSRRFLPRLLLIRGGLRWGFLQGRGHQRPHADRASWTSSPESSCGSSRVSRSWRRWTATC